MSCLPMVILLSFYRDNYEFPRSWLLPVIRDNLSDTELAFFTTYFLPLAAKLRTKCESKLFVYIISKCNAALLAFCSRRLWTKFLSFFLD